MVRHKNYPDDLRERLVAVMLQHLRTQDPDDVPLRDLAAECDTSTNAVYSIFGSKDALIDEVARVAREDFLRPSSSSPTTASPRSRRCRPPVPSTAPGPGPTQACTA